MMIRCGLFSVLFLVGCGDWVAADARFSNYFTGQTCSPNPLTYQAKSALKTDHQSNGNVSPTGIPGDNMDDSRSGKVDCLYDGNSGQGDDKKHPECNAEDFPQPGCDDEGCCEDCDEPEEEPAGEDPKDDPPQDDPPQDDPPQDDPPQDDPPQDEDPV